MEERDLNLISGLLPSNPELQSLMKEHQELERKIDDLDRKAFLSEDEKVEKKRLQSLLDAFPFLEDIGGAENCEWLIEDPEQALGLVEKTHADLFRTIYVDRKIDIRSPTFASLAEFYSKYGVSAADFTATSESFAIKAKLKRNEELIKAYGADGTPTFIVNGKYRFSGQSAGGYEKIEPLVHYLIDKEAKGG